MSSKAGRTTHRCGAFVQPVTKKVMGKSNCSRQFMDHQAEPHFLSFFRSENQQKELRKKEHGDLRKPPYFNDSMI